MKVVDANVLLYAVNESSLHHDEARGWLDGALSGGATVGFSWVALLAFLRLSTKAGVFPRPLTVTEATDRARRWLARPTATLIEPTVLHLEILTRLLEGVGTGGNLTTDAHLATLALEHRAEVVTYDADFGRFPGVAWRYPSKP